MESIDGIIGIMELDEPMEDQNKSTGLRRMCGDSHSRGWGGLLAIRVFSLSLVLSFSRSLYEYICVWFVGCGGRVNKHVQARQAS